VTRSAVLRRLVSTRGAVSLPGLLLAGVVGLAAVLAYQAQAAARSNMRRAEATLRDYSAFAAVEYGRQLRLQVQPLLRLTLQGVPAALNFLTPPVDPDARGVEALVREQWDHAGLGMRCGCLDSVRFYFRVDVAAGAIDAAAAAGAPAVTDSLERWARDFVLGQIPRVGDAGPPTVRTLGTIDDDGRSRDFGFFISNDSYVLSVDAPAGTPRLLAWVLARDSTGAPLTAYGYETAPGPWLRPLLERALREERLLPPSLLRGLPNEEVLAVSLRDAGGRELYRSSERFDARYAAADTLAGRFGDLRVHVAIYPELADQLLVGGLPRSRLPVLLALFALTAGLAVVALLQVKRQQQLARLRTDFVSSVSHELRTPLAQIRWFAELLRLGRLRSEEERDRSLRVIDQEARRLTFLVENVLNFSRSGREAGRLKPEPIVVADEVRDAVEGFLPLVHARRMHVAADLQPGAAGVVDRAALRQILLNLLDNAVKYGPVGQTIGVRVTREGSRVQLSVEDEGPGIPEHERERVWSPFYRAERDLGTEVTGSGIGLSVVNELVLVQNGRRWIERTPGGGARVVVDFPAPAVVAAPATPEDDPDDDGPVPEDPLDRRGDGTAGGRGAARAAPRR
jgi:signal transduction histidine kinase